MKSLVGWGLRGVCFVLAIPLLYATVEAQVVPGTGVKLNQVGDDFEEESWKWVQNGAKASREQDEQVRSPLGVSSNRRWFESPKRGMPDHIVRVETPAGGLPGSKGALKIQTLNSGVPGLNSFQMEQSWLCRPPTATPHEGHVDRRRRSQGPMASRSRWSSN